MEKFEKNKAIIEYLLQQVFEEAQEEYYSSQSVLERKRKESPESHVDMYVYNVNLRADRTSSRITEVMDLLEELKRD